MEIHPSSPEVLFGLGGRAGEPSGNAPSVSRPPPPAGQADAEEAQEPPLPYLVGARIGDVDDPSSLLGLQVADEGRLEGLCLADDILLVPPARQGQQQAVITLHLEGQAAPSGSFRHTWPGGGSSGFPQARPPPTSTKAAPPLLGISRSSARAARLPAEDVQESHTPTWGKVL